MWCQSSWKSGSGCHEEQIVKKKTIQWHNATGGGEEEEKTLHPRVAWSHELLMALPTTSMNGQELSRSDLEAF